MIKKKLNNLYFALLILVLFVPEFIYMYERYFGKYHSEKISNNIQKVLDNNSNIGNSVAVDDIFIIIFIVIYLYVSKIIFQYNKKTINIFEYPLKKYSGSTIFMNFFILTIITLSIVFIYNIYTSKINTLVPELDKVIKNENTNNFDKEYRQYVYYSSIRSIVFFSIYLLYFLYYTGFWNFIIGSYLYILGNRN